MKHDPALERQALLEAYREFTGVLDVDAQFGRFTIDRRAFGELARACDALIKALDAFSFHPATANNRLTLLTALRNAMGPEGDHETALTNIAALLGQVSAAARPYAGRGRPADDTAHTWVWIAADRWRKVTGNEPSASERGRFLNALADLHLHLSKEQAERLPKDLSRDTVRLALQERQERLRALGG